LERFTEGFQRFLMNNPRNLRENAADTRAI